MTFSRNNATISVALFHALAAGMLLSGCGMATRTATTVSNQPGPPVTQRLSGMVHGGQQPVSNAHVYLFAASQKTYGGASTSLLSTSAPGVTADSSGNGYVTSDASGNFTITGDYTCPSGALVYVTAIGGNPGLTSGTWNSASAMMTALGPCSGLSSSTFIMVNEVTTVASSWALAPFMADATHLGSSASNVIGLTSAFSAVTELADTTHGTASGPSLPSGAVLPVAEINTIADIVATCVNSQGGVAGDGTACGGLFDAATPSAIAVPPADTIAAMLNIAQNPSLSSASLFPLLTGMPPFQPTLTSAPSDWTIAIQYHPAGVSTPKAMAIDAGGNVWIASCGSASCTTTGVGSITQLSTSGAVVGTTSSGGINIPYAIAIDLQGNAWVANYGGNSVTELNPSMAPVAPAYTGGGLTQPNSIVIDNVGNAWLSNANSSTLSEFSSAGVAQAPTTVTGLTAPVAIAINPR